MKKEKTWKSVVEKIAIRIATADANTVCPWISYQPKEPKAMKKLRKF